VRRLGAALVIPNLESGVMPPHSKALRATLVIFMRHWVRYGA
jgi:hypothetical protein